MAEVVRRNRGRLAWQAVGVNGAGLLDRRIDRLLRGDAFARFRPTCLAPDRPSASLPYGIQRVIAANEDAAPRDSG